MTTLKAKHIGLLESFISESSTKQPPTKRKRLCEDEASDNNEASVSIQSQLSLSEAFRPSRRKVVSNEEALNYVLWYIVEAVLPISHVESDPFKEFLNGILPGIAIFFLYFINLKVNC